MKSSQGVASVTVRKRLHGKAAASASAALFVVALVSACGTGQNGGKDDRAPVASSQTMSVEDKSLGLDKNDVFATPDPIVAPMQGGDPGENQRMAAYFDGAPPSIPHQIDEFLPIRADENQCLDCHDDPGSLGTTVAEGDPTPMPATHYTDLRRTPDKIGDGLIGARFVCVQCHAPQHDAPPLVVNTYKQ